MNARPTNMVTGSPQPQQTEPQAADPSLRARVSGAEGRAASLSAVAEFWLESRRWREACLPGDLFGEPAWDVLLALFVAGEKRRDLHQAEVIALARVPKTTAGRVFDRLESEGLIRRRGGRDVRKRYLALTEDGRRRMVRLLTTIARQMLEATA